MTTDITELAQSLENAASKALIEEGLTWFSEEQLSHEDGIALHKADAEFVAVANPANVLALVEALEKAQAQQKFSFSMTQNEMEKYAEMYRSDNNDSSSAFLPASEITWIEGFLSPHAFSSVFTHESATNWLNSEVKIHKGDQIADTYIDLQKNPAVNPVVVVFQKGKPMIWDGYHRIAAAIIRGRPIYAIFSISLLEPLVLATELESRTVTVKMPKPHAHLIWIQAGHAPDDYWDDVAVSHSEKDRCCDGSERYPVYARWEIEEMLTAAGIKVEAE
ncbi:hypothetical protein SH582_09630 [Raoultella ornithinolytica]|uniref:hypothetical protein n=1 Tax=Raoultella ornithinolytica TaxID=54291 RepID=UPI002A5A07E5|nr:hypothetical protein [Raoultella ornithinolytica]WPO26122.1 hypothetical protein SH582_09630 [Raoultella ornithinolytica]